jgi:hypothetical protein
VTYERRDKVAGSVAERLPCVVCGEPIKFETLVWRYVPQGADDPTLIRYAHGTHAGRVSPETVTVET